MAVICKSGNLLEMLVNRFRRKHKIHPEMDDSQCLLFRKSRHFFMFRKMNGASDSINMENFRKKGFIILT